MANDISQLQTDLEDLDYRVTALDGDNGEIAGIKTRLTTAESDIDSLEAAIATLNANDTTTGSVDYKIKQALSTTNSNVS
jgi:chromosome segregation ATPase